ncbi:MAG: YidB family protein [Casimicrobiaceae bacterium]
MGLLDGILGNVLGSITGGSAGGLGNQNNDNPLGSILSQLGGGSGVGKMAFMALAFQLLQQSGGITGLIDKLRNSGLGQHADSWVGTGQNMPVSGDQLSNAIGPDVLSQLAHKFGMTQNQASGGLAQLLPELVNQMTPQGQVPDDHHDLISDALAQLAPKSRS